MNVSIQGHNFKVTPSLEDYTRKKLNRLDRYLPNIMDIRVDLSVQKTSRGEDLSIAQITLRHGRGAILRAEEKLQSNDKNSIQSAVNVAIDKMYRQIERFKGKRKSSRKIHERFTATLEELETAEEIPSDVYDEPLADYDFDYPDAEIVRRKEIMVSPMTESEAVSQMELLGHSFFMFFNANTNSVNVLYRRIDGDYGVLVPKMS